MEITAKISIDWLDEEGSIDEEVEAKILQKVTDKILLEVNKDIASQIVSTAQVLIKAKTELLINTALESPITVTEGWNSKTKYDSVYAMLEKKMTDLFRGKITQENGKCNIDPFLDNLNSYVKNECDRLLTQIQKIVTARGTAAAKEELQKSELLKAINIAITEKGAIG